jgi:hypothetical protein
MPMVQSSDGTDAALRDALMAQGLADAPPCTDLRIDVRQAQTGLLVRRAQTTRTVPDLHTAVVLVETWVNADLADPLLAARAAPTPPAPPVTARVPKPVVTPSARALHVDFGLQGGAASDRTAWGGLHAQGCLMLGPICGGVRAQVSVDPGASGSSKDARIWRLGMGVLAVGDLALRPVRIGLGLGVTAVRLDGQKGGNDDVRGAPLVQARILYDLPISEAWGMSVGVIGEWAAWGREQPGQNRSGTRNGREEEEFPDLAGGSLMASIAMRWSGQ